MPPDDPARRLSRRQAIGALGAAGAAWLALGGVPTRRRPRARPASR